MINYAKAHGFLQGSLEIMADTLEIKIAAKYLGTVTVPKEVKEELKAMIAKMIKGSEEVGREPSEFMSIPEYDKELNELEEEIEEGEASGWPLEESYIKKGTLI